jgi:hypothetical protein
VTLERDDKRLAEADATQADLEMSSPATADELDQMTDEEAAEAIEIRTEIEETRLEMGGTLSELGDRLEPGHLVNQAKENVREATIGRVEETAKGMSDMVMETIRRNPIPAALAGAGLAMLWANRSNGHNGNTGERRYGAYYGTTSSYGQHQPYGEQRQGMGDRVGDVASKVGENVGRTVGDVGQNVGRTVGDVGENVGQGIGQVGGQLDRFMHASPLAMGAIALGAGALIGAVLPETQQEREMLSDAGRQIGNTVRDTVDQATSKAEQAMDKAEEKVTSGSSR